LGLAAVALGGGVRGLEGVPGGVRDVGGAGDEGPSVLEFVEELEVGLVEVLGVLVELVGEGGALVGLEVDESGLASVVELQLLPPVRADL